MLLTDLQLQLEILNLRSSPRSYLKINFLSVPGGDGQHLPELQSLRAERMDAKVTKLGRRWCLYMSISTLKFPCTSMSPNLSLIKSPCHISVYKSWNHLKKFQITDLFPLHKSSSSSTRYVITYMLPCTWIPPSSAVWCASFAPSSAPSTTTLLWTTREGGDAPSSHVQLVL